MPNVQIIYLYQMSCFLKLKIIFVSPVQRAVFTDDKQIEKEMKT